MATQTFQHSSFGGGSVVVEIDVRDNDWRVTRIRCVNNSPHPVGARVLQNGVQVFPSGGNMVIAPANDTTQWNVTGVQLGWDAVDGGIQMGTYELQARWPATV